MPCAISRVLRAVVDQGLRLQISALESTRSIAQPLLRRARNHPCDCRSHEVSCPVVMNRQLQCAGDDAFCELDRAFLEPFDEVDVLRGSVNGGFGLDVHASSTTTGVDDSTIRS